MTTIEATIELRGLGDIPLPDEMAKLGFGEVYGTAVSVVINWLDSISQGCDGESFRAFVVQDSDVDREDFEDGGYLGGCTNGPWFDPTAGLELVRLLHDRVEQMRADELISGDFSFVSARAVEWDLRAYVHILERAVEDGIYFRVLVVG